MAEIKTLEPIPALYDFVLYFECADKDWKKGAKKTSIKGDGSLMDLINWDSTYSYDPDDAGGKTLFGVTESTWESFVKKYPNKGYNKDLNTMGKQGWMDQIEWFWKEKSSCGLCANYGCAFVMLQMVWLGFNLDSQKKLLSKLKLNADIKDYPFITSGSLYKKIADATHAYTNTLTAYEYMRKANSAYLYNKSAPGSKNNKFRMGWLNRSALSYTPYGLYVPVRVDGKTEGLNISSTLDEWETTAIELVKSNKKGYVKIMDWGESPESIDTLNSSDNSYANSNLYSSNNSGSSSNNALSNAYSGCNSINQLGSYTNTPLAQMTQQAKNRESVLNTLVNGSQSPSNIKTCAELITVEKKKGVKTKSES